MRKLLLFSMLITSCNGKMNECEQVLNLEAQWIDEICQADNSCFCQCWNDENKIVSDVLQCHCKEQEKTTIVCENEKFHEAQLCLAHEDACWLSFYNEKIRYIESEICRKADAIYNIAKNEECEKQNACCLCYCLEQGMDFDSDYFRISGRCECIESISNPCIDDILEQAQDCVDKQNLCEENVYDYVVYWCDIV